MVLENEQPESVDNSSEPSASVTAAVSRLLEGHLEGFGAIEREGVGTSRLVNYFDVLSVEFRASMDVDLLVFHEMLTEVNLLVLFIGFIVLNLS